MHGQNAVTPSEKLTIAWVILLIGSIAVWLASPWWAPLLQGDHSAEWVAAMGSMMAVGAAILVVSRQIHFERTRQAREEVRRLHLLWTFVYHCRVEMEYLRSTLDYPDPVYHEPSGLRHNVAALRGVPTLDLVDADAAVAVLTVIEAYAAFSAGLPAPKNTQTAASWAKSVIPYANAALENFEFSERRLRMVLRDRGADLPPGHLYLMNGTPYPPHDPYL